MFPNVADFVGERDGIFVNVQRLRRGRSVRLTSRGRKMGGGRIPNTDIVAALVR